MWSLRNVNEIEVSDKSVCTYKSSVSSICARKDVVFEKCECRQLPLLSHCHHLWGLA